MDRRTKLLGRFKIVNNLRSPSLSKVVNGMKVFSSLLSIGQGIKKFDFRGREENSYYSWCLRKWPD